MATVPSYIAGVRYLPGADRFVRQLVPGQELHLKRVTDNDHDPNAIAIVIDGGLKIGWVPMALTAKLAPYVEQGRVKCFVAEKGNPRGSIDLIYSVPGEPGFES